MVARRSDGASRCMQCGVNVIAVPAAEPEPEERGEPPVPQFKPGDRVFVEASRYTGPGVVARDGHYDEALVWMRGEFHVAVTPWIGAPDFSRGYLHSNTWLYPATGVRRASSAEPAPETRRGGVRCSRC